jgi:hypothetical protein
LAARIVVDAGLEAEVAALAQRPVTIHAGLVTGQPDWPLQAAVVSGDGVGTLKGVPPPPHEATVHGVLFGAEPADVAALLMDGAGLTARGVPERLPLQHAPYLVDAHAWRAVVEPPSGRLVRAIEQVDDNGKVLAVAELTTRPLAYAEAAVTALPPPGVRTAALSAARARSLKGRQFAAGGAGSSYAGVAAGTGGAKPVAARQPGPLPPVRLPVLCPSASTSAAAGQEPVNGHGAMGAPAAQPASLAPAPAQALVRRAQWAAPPPLAAEEMPPPARSRLEAAVDLPPSARAACRSPTPHTDIVRPRSRSPRAVRRAEASGTAVTTGSARSSPARVAPEAANGAGWKVAGRHRRHTPVDDPADVATAVAPPDAAAHA